MQCEEIVADGAGVCLRQAMAEREGFEPSIGVSLYSLSRGAPSAARPPLRNVTAATTEARF